MAMEGLQPFFKYKRCARCEKARRRVLNNTTNVVAPITSSGAQNSDLDYVKIAQELIFKHNIVSFKGFTYIYQNGMYREDHGIVDKAITHILIAYGVHGKDSFTGPTLQIKHLISSLTTVEDYPFNQQRDLIPVRNGVIKVDSDGKVELVNHSPDYLFTYQLPVDYNPTVDTGAVIEFLNSTGCSHETLLQIPAQSLLSKWGRNYKKCYLLKGVKNSGKSTYLNLLNLWFFGKENCSNISLDILINDTHASSGIVGKIANIADELSKIRLGDVGQFKSMTGAGMITINRKYFDTYSYKCDVTFIFATNDYPPVSQDDPAFFERFGLVDFTVVHKIDPTYEERTFTPDFLSGFLNLVIRRLLEIQKDGIKSDPWNVTREKWLNDSDPFYRYVNSCLEQDNESFIVGADLYSHYEKTCLATNQIPISLKEFSSRIQELGALHRQRQVSGEMKWGYLGFRIKDLSIILNG